MRWLLALVGSFFLILQASAQETPQEMYRSMEDKVAKGKALKVAFSSEEVLDSKKRQVFGELILASENRMRLTLSHKDKDEVLKEVFVSDGKKIINQGDDGKKKSRNEMKEAEIKLATHFRNSLKGAGFQMGFLAMGFENLSTSAKYKASAFKDLGKEKLDGREVSVIGYKLAQENEGQFTCKIWIEAKTGMPLKRVLEEKNGLRIVETFSKWQLDPELPEGTFVLPK